MANIAKSAYVNPTAYIADTATISGYAKISDNATICDNAYISGYAKISDNAKISGNAKIYGYAEISGYATISDNADISINQHYLVMGPMGSRESYVTFFRSKTESGYEIWVNCGCFSGNLESFLEKVKLTHGENGYAKQYQLAAELAKVSIQDVD